MSGALLLYIMLLIFRGKGDYYRLGHGDDSHQRTPCRVLGLLANEKVVDIGCGSLHCVVCTENGNVYAWGDNDEGQIGNDTTQAVSVPKVGANSPLMALACIVSPFRKSTLLRIVILIMLLVDQHILLHGH